MSKPFVRAGRNLATGERVYLCFLLNPPHDDAGPIVGVGATQAAAFAAWRIRTDAHNATIARAAHRRTWATSWRSVITRSAH